MTINKSQGMTLDKCLFDARHAPFQHGHAYVLFSRVRNRHSIGAVVDAATCRNGQLITKTVLYSELLDEPEQTDASAAPSSCMPYDCMCGELVDR